MAEGHDAGDDGRRRGVVGHRRHEGAVDLELVERERAEVGQRRVARPEVVDRDPHAERAQLGQVADGGAHVEEQRAFGDLEAEVGRVGAGGLEHGRHPAGEIGPHQLAGRQVHRHPGRQAHGTPAGQRCQ